MNKENYIKWSLSLTFAGFLFAGYLSMTKLLSETCAFNESCPYFLGYPACYFGFAMFSIMFVASILALLESVSQKVLLKTNLVVSTLGILFAGYFGLQEILVWVKEGQIILYTLGLPTCVYGFIFYVIIFFISLRVMLLSKEEVIPSTEN